MFCVLKYYNSNLSPQTEQQFGIPATMTKAPFEVTETYFAIDKFVADCGITNLDGRKCFSCLGKVECGIKALRFRNDTTTMAIVFCKSCSAQLGKALEMMYPVKLMHTFIFFCFFLFAI